MAEQLDITKPNPIAMNLALDLWVRRLQRVCDEQANRALNGHEPQSLIVIAPTQADAALIEGVLRKACDEARAAALKEAWRVAEYYTQYGVLPQRSKEREVADAITDGIRKLFPDVRDAKQAASPAASEAP
jgi:hypothetical protein